MPQQFKAPCGWRCNSIDEQDEPAVGAALETLRAAGLQAVIVWRRETTDREGADFTHDDRNDAQAFAGDAGGLLCHLSRVQPVEGK